MIDYLFEDRPQDDEILIPLTRADAVELRKRLLTGTTKKFLGVEDGAIEDGCFLNPTAEMYEQMKTMPWSTDLMEGSHAQVDNFFRSRLEGH